MKKNKKTNKASCSRNKRKKSQRRRHMIGGATVDDFRLWTTCHEYKDEPGNPTRMEKIIELVEVKGANVNFEAQSGTVWETPVITCCRVGNEDILQYLLSKGASPNQISGGRSISIDPKFTAVNKEDRVNCLAILLSAPGANVNVRNRNHMNETLLSFAVSLFGLCTSDPTQEWIYHHHQKRRTELIEIITMLLAHGADVNARQEFDMTILMRAVCIEGEKARSLVNLLIENGADVNAVQNHSNRTALWYLASGYRDSEEDRMLMAELLISKGANISTVAKEENGTGTTASEIARRRRRGSTDYIEKFDKIARRGSLRKVFHSIKDVNSNLAIWKVLQNDALQRELRSYLG